LQGPLYVARHKAVAIDRYLLQTRARPQQQTRRPPLLLLTDGADGRTFNRFMTHRICIADRTMIYNQWLK